MPSLVEGICIWEKYKFTPSDLIAFAKYRSRSDFFQN